jgi:hypothetical protein
MTTVASEQPLLVAHVSVVTVLLTEASPCAAVCAAGSTTKSSHSHQRT